MDIRTTIIEPFNSKIKAQTARAAKLLYEANVLEAKAKKKRERYSQIMKAKKGPKELIELIAKAVGEHIGCNASVGGPCGIFCRYSVSFNGKEPYNRDQRYHLTVQAEYDEQEGCQLFYETGHSLTNYPTDSIGAFNGGNIETKPLPDTIEALADIITKKQR